MTGRPNFRLRPARDEDSQAVLEVMEVVYGEYGFVFAVDEEMPEMRRVASSFAAKDGCFWVVEDEAGRVVGFVGCAPSHAPPPAAGVPSGPILELKRLYVHPDRRRLGLGALLVVAVEDEARRRRSVAVDLWSDTRLPDGHRLYERCGYTRTPITRDLGDLSRSVELYFWKRVG